MKKLLTVTALCLFSFYGNSQVTATKTKMFFWGDTKTGFEEFLTPNAKILLDSAFKVIPVDTTNVIKLNSDNFLEHLIRENLSKRHYESVSIYQDNGTIFVRKYVNNIYPPTSKIKKVSLRYSKDESNTIEKLTLHVID
jgi:hypothetical protein